MGFDYQRQLVQFLAGVALIIRQTDRVQPEFGAIPVFSYRHMDRLARVAFVGKKEEALSLKLKNVWHE